jgi:hypothetical protein
MDSKYRYSYEMKDEDEDQDLIAYIKVSGILKPDIRSQLTGHSKPSSNHSISSSPRALDARISLPSSSSPERYSFLVWRS